MKKKIDIFWYWFLIIVAFVVCFMFSSIKASAYSLDSNGNLVSDNLYIPNNINSELNSFFSNNVKTYTVSAYGYSIIESSDNQKDNVGFYFNLTRNANVEVGKVYTVTFDITSNNLFEYFKVGLEGNQGYISTCTTHCHFTGIAYDRFNYVIYGYGGSSSITNNIYSFDNLMIYEGEYDPDKSFEPYGIWYKESSIYNPGYIEGQSNIIDVAKDKVNSLFPNITMADYMCTTLSSGAVDCDDAIKSYIQATYNYSKTEGYENASNDGKVLGGFIPNLLGGFGSFLLTVLNIDILGFNLISVIGILITVLGVIVVIKFLKG